ncbi:DUF4340 domain-containing protein [Pseudobutyrivibrio ruminis]|uniref:DUF4340 domain-containing protein n=1 Tax=Pseudobutyrivibrio ruminis DSM 9787 TaxID=1123011 RepID=A0A285RA36_9FIRM|nr:DUF4340 domain-containing protein [Pseudobutyrivibrio ruminis]SOB90734.1 protein of unknown function [Pseudobutyrivibrio ruminis DSM 9787]
MKKFISKNYKGIFLALAIVLLIVVLIITLYSKNPVKMIQNLDNSEDTAEVLDEASEIEDEGENVILLDNEEVYSFQITDSNNIMLTFERDGDDWVYPDDSTIDINEERIEKLLNYITDVRFVDVIVNDSEDGDGDEYGLNQDSPVYTIKDANGYSTFISIGKTDDKTGQVYFALNYDFSTVYVNSGKLAGVNKYAIEDLIQ